MATGKKTGGKNFQPGNKLGRGQRAHNPALKAVRRLTHDEVADLGSFVLEGNREALVDVKQNPASSVLRVWFAAIAIKAIDRGDPTALSILLDRIVGRVKEKVEVTGKDGAPLIPQMTREELEAEIAKSLEKNRIVHEEG